MERADVDDAYLFRKLEVRIIIEEPTHSNEKGENTGDVYKLLMSLYGSKKTWQDLKISFGQEDETASISSSSN